MRPNPAFLQGQVEALLEVAFDPSLGPRRRRALLRRVARMRPEDVGHAPEAHFTAGCDGSIEVRFDLPPNDPKETRR